MKPSSGFIISIFCFLLTAPFCTHAQQKDCRKIDATVQVTDSADGQQGSIKVTAGGSEAKFMLHLFDEAPGSKFERVKITNGTIDNVPPGNYSLIIHSPDPKFCTETRKVTVN